MRIRRFSRHALEGTSVGVVCGRGEFEVVWNLEKTFADDVLLHFPLFFKNTLAIVCVATVRWDRISGIAADGEIRRKHTENGKPFGVVLELQGSGDGLLRQLKWWYFEELQKFFVLLGL